MKSNWKKTKIGDIVDIRRGASPRPIQKFLSQSGMPWVKIADATSDTSRFLSKTKEFIIEGGISKSVLVEPETLIVSNSATPGLPKIMKITACVHDGWLVFSNYRGVLRDFLYYKFIDIRRRLVNQSNGSVFQNLKTDIVREFDIYLPNLKTQEKIVSILLSIDEKIENNNKINNNLEQQAQAIFKEWFIDNPENNKWSTGIFSELINLTLNGDWGKETPIGNNIKKVYCIRGADIPEVKAGNKGKIPTRYILPKNFATKQLTDGDIVVEISGGSPTQSTGRCTAITQSLLDRYDSGIVCTNFCKAIKPKEGYSMFVYYYWQYLYNKGVFFSYENGTTGIKNLDFSGFIETETILIPPTDQVIAFENYCKSIFNQVFANGKQNEHLDVLRDTLLPKLMSGELDISNIDL